MSFNKSKKRIAGGVLGIIVFIIFSMIPVIEPLEPKAFVGIGCLFAAVIFILFDVVPDFVAALAMCVTFVLTHTVPIGVAFSTFSSATIWIVIGALGLGTAASTSGLLKRVALYLMRVMPANYIGQTLSLIISGFVIAPLIPSTAAKATIVAPIARTTSEALGIEPHSKPAIGMFMAFYTGFISSANGFLSASFVSYALVGLMPEDKGISWMNWFIYGLPFMLITFLLMTLVIVFVWRPKGNNTLSKAYIQSQIDELGKMTWQEKVTGIVMLVCLVLWMLEKVLNVSAAMVACAGALVVLAAGVYDKKVFRTMIPWENIIFVGCFLSITNVFPALKINEAISFYLGDKLSFVVSSPYILVTAMCVLVYVLRTILVSNTACVTLITVLLMPLCIERGIHPFILIFVGYAAANIWVFSYQNSPTIMSLAATDNKLVEHKDLIPASLYYMVFCLVASLASVPFWSLLGLIR
ncbi:MAG: SLC13 family permease [Lachnospiraceae bacterium]